MSSFDSSAPAEIVNATHRGGWVIIVSAIGLVLLLLCLLIRLYVRFAFSTIAGWPDVVLASAGGFGLVQTCLTFWQVSYGLGTSINLLPLDHIQPLHASYFASTVLYLIAVWLSRCCVLCVYLQLTPNARHNRATYCVMAFATVWVICSCLMLGVDCGIDQEWVKSASHCANMFLRWQLIIGIGIVMEISLLGLAVYLVVGLQMPFKRKAIVVTAFGLRLFVIIPTAIHLHYVAKQISSPDPTLAAANTSIWTEVEMHLCIIACICYCFKSFTAAVSTNYGSVAINLEVYDTVNGPSGLVPSKMSASAASHSQASEGSTTDRKVPFSGPDRYNRRTTVTGGPRAKNALHATASDEVMIMEEVRVESEKIGVDGHARTISDYSQSEERR